MKRLETNLSVGIWALPSFPLVLVTVGRNIMTAAAFHFYSFDPPSVMVGIIPEKYTYELVSREKELGINIPRVDQIELVRFCGSVSGREVENKYERAGVTPLEGVAVRGMVIREYPVNIECEVVHQVDYPGTHRWFIGEIKAVHVHETYERDQALMFWSREYRRVGEFLEKA